MTFEPFEHSFTGVAGPDLFCPECQYDLRGNTTARCPECGMAFDVGTLAVSRIPWAKRHITGWTIAFFRTAWWVTFFPQRVAREMSRPVDYHEAQLFRRAVVVVNTLTAMIFFISWQEGKRAAIGTFFSSITHSSSLWDVAFDNYAEVPWNIAANTVAIGLMLWVMTGVHSAFFRTRQMGVEQGNRAVALAGYAAGPMAFFPVAVLVYVSAFALAGYVDSRQLPMVLRLATTASLAVLICPVLLWMCQLALLRLAAGASLLRVVVAAVVIPVLWVVVGTAAALAVPALVFWGLLAWHSLR